MKVHGAIDGRTRCKHYHSERDIIAIKMKCCETYYSCYYCHQEEAGHVAAVWPAEQWNTPAVLCGNCRSKLTVRQYMDCDYSCPSCGAAFNPGCKLHNHYYFETEHSD
ncbi:CHY zinc finger protein [Paenibacillus gansuensis]|uniref:CHY zinc finger protein n=1 Tax=Paenibacillus gansuensis TaxID=306542 RepID=A0ABW5P9P5_9BACL